MYCCINILAFMRLIDGFDVAFWYYSGTGDVVKDFHVSLILAKNTAIIMVHNIIHDYFYLCS